MSNIGEKPRLMSKVNLDAIIKRQDFYSDAAAVNKQFAHDKLTLAHLVKDELLNVSSIYHLLKKPDFQRETCEWSKEKILHLIESFMNRSFIPSIILWENPKTSEIYVIDGAHRLSAILAYINDDYGDKEISQAFYNYKIPAAELSLAQETREYINDRIGSFADNIKEGGEKANGIRNGFFDVQKINGDVRVAEDSFFKINEQGVPLSPTEKELCHFRHRPSCISTRAIMKGGAGNQYWKNFTKENQAEIKNLADELHKLLFEPSYEENLSSIIREHPLGGEVITGMPMVYNLMKIIKKHYYNGKEVDDMVDGETTKAYLLKVRKILWIIFGEEKGSLGLFPTIYFYNGIGKYIQSSFIGMFQLIVENENNTNFKIKFTQNRRRIEDFLIEYKIFLTQLNLQYGSKERSAGHMKWFFENLFNYISENSDNSKVIDMLKVKYNFLNEKQSSLEKTKSNRFTTDVKTSVTIKNELNAALKCKICKGYIHLYSKDFDHDIDRKYHGKSDEDNAQITHVYCNKSKDELIKRGVYVRPS